jgi:hypothetical protein
MRKTPLLVVWLVCMGVLLLQPKQGHVSETRSESGVLPGTITNAVHPGDPVQQTTVVGFVSLQDALKFVANDFQIGGLEPRFNTVLKRGDSTRFAGANYLVFYYLDAEQKPALLSIARCHGDLHLVFGSCGFQFLLSVKTEPAPAQYPLR